MCDSLFDAIPTLMEHNTSLNGFQAVSTIHVVRAAGHGGLIPSLAVVIPACADASARGYGQPRRLRSSRLKLATNDPLFVDVFLMIFTKLVAMDQKEACEIRNGPVVRENPAIGSKLGRAIYHDTLYNGEAQCIGRRPVQPPSDHPIFSKAISEDLE